MEIQKIFSNIENPRENLYSVLMNEEELNIFSELQKEFARRDYEGLSDAGKKALRTRRNQYARSLKENYLDAMHNINSNSKLKYNNDPFVSKASIIGGGVKSNVHVITNDDGSLLALKRHKDSVTNEMLKESAKAKDIMRNDILTTSSYVEPKSVNVKSNVPVPKTSRAMDILKKNKKALLIGGSLAAAGAGIGYGIHKHRQNKK